MKIPKLEKELMFIYTHILDSEKISEKLAAGVHKDYTLSAKNLYRYLVLRSYDLRKYHDSLSDLGISALRSAEAYVLSNLQNVISILRMLQAKPPLEPVNAEIIGYKKSKKILRKHANRLFNSARKRHFTEIMVTLPEEAAANYELIEAMVDKGMEIARINLSHGDLDQWKGMVDNINQLRNNSGQDIKIYMDLSGPKIRTSSIEIQDKSGKTRNSIKVKAGEHLILTREQTSGKDSVYGDKNQQIEMAEVGVLLPEIIDDVKINDVIHFDDGMISGRVVDKDQDKVELLITDTYKTKLSSYKGINLPNTKLNLPSLTDRDIELLPFVCAHADMLGYSFVRTAEDVQRLYAELDKIDAHDIGVIFKIENQEAFKNLPAILLEGMKRAKIGVMIARGDLAVEIGYERISEVQNQILWLCEAAHVPVIWATQVLENLAKTGIATRAEISDASQSASAECVMLNKGPYILDAIDTLKQILIKMESHSFKKKNALRALNLAKNALNEIV